MAQTYTVTATGVSFALNKSMIALFNGVGSGRVLRVYRVLMLNTGVATVTGGLNTMELRRLSAGSGGTPLPPVKHASANESFPAQIVAATNATVTVTDLFRRWVWSTDEPVAAAAATIDELETLPVFNTIFESGYGDTTVEPIVIREGYGLSVQCTGSNTAGTCDLAFLCTLANS